MPPSIRFDSSQLLRSQHLVVGLVEVLGARAQLLRAQLGERLALLDRVADQAADDAVRLAERHAAADQQVGDLGRGQHLVAGGGLQPLAVELDPGQHPLGRVEAGLDRVDRVEERLLVLLHVLAVGERQGVHRPQQRRVARRRPAGLFARSSSAESGFTFCGMIEEPEEKDSSSSQKPNSLLDQMTISEPSRERCIAQVEAAAR